MVEEVVELSTAKRRLDVLRAIVIEYVNTKEPVASKAVAQSYVQGVSSATIRNDMGVLEDEGLIRQPHTSAGRVPTEAGYRIFVDCLDPSAAQVARNRALFVEQLGSVESLEDAIRRTVRVLAGITGQAAMAEYPDLIADRIRRVEIVDLDDSRVLVIVVTSAGKVLERQITVPSTVAGANWDRVRDLVNRAIEGVAADEVMGALSKAEVETELEGAYALASSAVQESLRALETSRIVTAGAANLARSGVDFRDVASVLDVLEDQTALMQILHRMHMTPIQVSIGTENLHEGLTDVSLVSAMYAASGHVGVIGPTRMDYARSLAAVEAVSGYLSRLLLKQSGASGDARAEDAGEETE